MDDADIADTVIVPRALVAPRISGAVPTGALASDLLRNDEPDDSETLLRTPHTFPLVEPTAQPRLQPNEESVAAASDRRPESHAATLAPIPPAEQGAARYRYRVNGGEVIDLDVVTLIGRHPREPRVRVTEQPALVTVPSPEREVSGTHVELMQYGASIVVTDMHSTNGTRVVIPGAAPVVLRPGESVVAVPGTVIDIGDGNMIEILPMRRFVPDSPDFDRLLP